MEYISFYLKRIILFEIHAITILDMEFMLMKIVQIIFSEAITIKLMGKKIFSFPKVIMIRSTSFHGSD